MKLKYIFAALLLGLGSTVWMSYSSGYAAANLEGATGAPNASGGGKETTCQQCHGTGGPNTLQTSATIEIIDTVNGNKVTAYAPGKVYKARVTINKVSGNPVGYGFQLVSLIDATKADIKGWLNPGANVNIVNLTTGQKRSYAEQPKRSINNVFEVNWKAPAAASGKITFYAAGNGVNGNGTDGGDAGCVATLSLTEGTVSTDELLAEGIEMRLFPTVVATELQYNAATKASGTFFVKIFDIGGQLRQQQSVQLNEGVTQATIDVSGLHQGVYFLQLSNGRQGQTSKFIKE
jgi:Secretion system C-terminal sorting domain